ncbi:MAG: type II toxin-antitoxin system VapC family toxin [Actinobacteria bacterium]|nr:type II toxin-antitoxin system VapC family toxin [Actinomycetota bacterium]
MAVLDASVLAEALTNGAEVGHRARRRLRADTTWDAPHILPAEVLSAIRGLAVGGEIDPLVAERARARLRVTRLRLHAASPFLDRIWELRTNVTVYDAWYVALAERLDVVLVTADARLAEAAGPRCATELVTA